MPSVQQKALISLYSTFIFFMVRISNSNSIIYLLSSYFSMGYKYDKKNLERTMIGFIIYILSINIPFGIENDFNNILIRSLVYFILIFSVMFL